MLQNKTSKYIGKTFSYLMLAFITFLFIIPFLTILSASFSEESRIITDGYGIIPKGLTLEAYRLVLADSSQLINAYGVTILITILGAGGGTVLMSMAAFPISRNDYKWKSFFNMFFYITMIFSGGAVASYLVICQTLALRNSFWSLILPTMVNVWNIFLLRTYFKQVPVELIEAAQIDGASVMFSFFKIVVPIAKVGIVTVLVMMALSFWNQWYPSMMYMSGDQYMTLQYYIYRIMSEIDMLTKTENALLLMNGASLPEETARMAMCVLVAGPMVFVFMYFQKYFSKGVTVGSVKG